MRKHIRHGVTDNSGNVAIEFAFIFPMILLLMFGIVDICMALVDYRKVAQTCESLAWSTQAILQAPTSTSAADLPVGGSTTLSNIVTLTTTGMTQTVLGVYVHRLVRSAVTGNLADTVIYQSGPSIAANNTGIDTNLKNGDSRIVAQISYTHNVLFGIIGYSLPLSARYSM